MLSVKENKRIDGIEIHSIIESKLKDYSIWIKRKIEDADLVLDKDYFVTQKMGTGGRAKNLYEFTIDAAKEICLLEKNGKGKELRRWLIGISNQRQNLDLITVEEAAFAVKVINCLKYIENQKEARAIHQATFLAKNQDTISDKIIYSEFAKYRTNIVGWDKHSIDSALNDYIDNHSGYNRKALLSKDMSTKMSVMDIGEAIRIAVLDILYSKSQDSDLANKFSELCKKLAKQMQVQPEKENKQNLFRDKEHIDSVKEIGASVPFKNP